MKRRDFMIAIAVCAGVATPAVRELFIGEGAEAPVLAWDQPKPAEQSGQQEPLREPFRGDPEPPEPGPIPDPTPEPFDPPKDPEPVPDGCPACGMARVQPRGKKFLSTYTN